MVTKEMTIGELASKSDIPASTIRFYERKGLLAPASRTDAGYRQYNELSMERVRFILSAQAIGLSIKDIQELLQIADGNVCACDDVEKLLDDRLSDIRKKIKSLKQLEKTIAGALEVCRVTPDGKPCPFLSRGETDKKRRGKKS